MTDQAYQSASLAALLDILIPGNADFPAASQTTCLDTVFALPHGPEVVDAVLAALPDELNASPREKTVSLLMSLETSRPELFRALLEVAYGAYYSDPTVLSAVARKTGYQHPPQPFGYSLPAFDEAVLAIARNNPPSWRDTRI